MCGVKQRVIPGDFKKKMPLQVQCTVPYLCHILLVAGPFGRLIWIFLTWAFSFKEPANVSHLWVLFDILFYFFLHALKIEFFLFWSYFSQNWCSGCYLQHRKQDQMLQKSRTVVFWGGYDNRFQKAPIVNKKKVTIHFQFQRLCKITGYQFSLTWGN